jgi:hypothetical protein
MEKNNSYNRIKMCTCMGVMDMVRWILDSEQVLAITIYIYDECYGDGSMDTTPGTGASYYHQIYWNSFLSDHISLLFPSLFWTWAILLFFMP